MNEHDTVVLKSNYREIPSGTMGTIVHVWSETAFLVEFNINGKKYVETLSKDEIIKKKL